MERTEGSICEGKVTGITKFGAFVSFPDGRSGLVHISEVTNTYVNEITDHLAVGQTVRVKILCTDDKGRLNLSIKKAAETPAADRPQQRSRTVPPVYTAPRHEPSAEESLDDKIKAFMKDSESRQAGMNKAQPKRNRTSFHPSGPW